MKFPENHHQFEAMQAAFAARTKITKNSIDDLGAKLKNHENVSFVLSRLADSWQQPDPGKYEHAIFFLDQDGHRVVVSELLPSGTKVMTEDERRKLWDSGSRPYKYEQVPNSYRLVNLAEVAKKPCPECHQERPLAEHYVQTEDGPDGDEWKKEKLIVCLDCERITVLKSEHRENRF